MTPEFNQRRTSFQLIATTCLILFLELALIRWWAAEVRVVAYFPNLVLIASFLGLGAGALALRRGPLLGAWPWLLLANIVIAYGLSHIAFTEQDGGGALFLLYYDLGPSPITFTSLKAPVAVCFILVALCFVPLGQKLGHALEAFRAAGRPLKGYALDLVGSLVGVGLFTAVSFSEARPWLWFLVAAALSLLLEREYKWRHAVVLIPLALTIGTVIKSDHADYYSPYYAINLDEDRGQEGRQVSTNGSLHQVMHDLRASAKHDRPGGAWVDKIRQGYHFPYQQLNRPIRRALVLGAGTGNDVAVLLDEGALEVHAVEIDPVIIAIGRAHHPAKPYDSDRVTIFNQDARTFLNETENTYDVITFGTLDSMTRTSALSTVRLDNFVYTLDSLKQARTRLTDDGALVMFFMSAQSFIMRHLDMMLFHAFGKPAHLFRKTNQLFNLTLMAGPGYDHLESPPPPPADIAAMTVPTDAWPYLYLDKPGVSGFYLGFMLLLLVLSAALLLLVAPELRDFAHGRRPDWEMFCFGAAFLLMETRLVTAMGLVWGATWLTSAIVFAAFLTTMLAATLMTERRPLPWSLAIAGLFLSLGVIYLIDVQWMLSSNLPLRLLFSFLYAGIPIFFASLCFADRFAGRRDVSFALGWNVAGAVLGGLLEVTTMLIGLKGAVLLAGFFYLVVAFLRRRDLQQPSTPLATDLSPAP